MDRLVCGDVGFGKTEAALRAAVQAAAERLQATMLVLTIILAQHTGDLPRAARRPPVPGRGLCRLRSGAETKAVCGTSRRAGSTS